MMLWLKTTWTQIGDYKLGNSDYNDNAEESMKFWSERYKHFLKKGI